MCSWKHIIISMCDLEHTCGQEIGTMDPSKLLKSLQPHWYAPWASYMRNVPSAQLFTFDACRRRKGAIFVFLGDCTIFKIFQESFIGSKLSAAYIPYTSKSPLHTVTTHTSLPLGCKDMPLDRAYCISLWQPKGRKRPFRPPTLKFNLPNTRDPPTPWFVGFLLVCYKIINACWNPINLIYPKLKVQNNNESFYPRLSQSHIGGRQ